MNTTELIHDIYKLGARARREGRPCPFKARSLAAQIYSYGWLKEDLRLGLMEAKPSYGIEQRRFDDRDAELARLKDKKLP